MFGATNIVINNNERKYIYIGYGIAFPGAISWSFVDGFVGNVIILALIIVHQFIIIIVKIVSQN